MPAIKGVLIYVLDDKAQVKKWTEPSGVRAYYNLLRHMKVISTSRGKV